MKVTIYTTSTCPFSIQEKEYLQSKNIAFEEKNLEQNRDFLTELMAVSNNFAGTPVTKIEKDDGQSVVLKGFTKEEFENVLGSTAQVMQQPPAEPTSPTPPQPPTMEPPTTDAPPPPPPSVPEPQPEPPAPEPPTSQPEVPAAPAVSEPPAQGQPAPQQTEKDDSLDAILKDLQNKVNDAYSTQQQNQPTPSAPTPVDQSVEKPQEPPAPPQPTTPTPPTAVPDFPK